MIKEFDYKGIWFLPEKLERQVCGTLKFTPDEGAILDLIGSFKDITGINKMIDAKIILGIASNGTKITLYDCFETNSNFSSTGFQTSSFHASIVFVGAHFQKTGDIHFKSLSIHYSHLDEWVNISGFDIKQSLAENEVVIKYKLPQPFHANISDDLKISLNVNATGPSWSLVQKEATIKQKTKIKIEPSKDMLFEDYRKIINQIQNFLSLGVTEPVYPFNIEGTTEINKEIINDRVHNPPVEIFFKPPEIFKLSKILPPIYMLFTFKDISGRFESFLKNWLEKAELLEPVYNLYFGTLYNSHMYLEHKFLSLAQAIESYHQRIYEGKYLSDAQYKEVYNTLVNAIPNEAESNLKDRLKKYLQYGNEFSLRTRLKKIFNKHQEILDLFINKDHADAFINDIVNIRNYLTHYNKDSKEQDICGEVLYHLTCKLEILLEICLLMELGFSQNEIKSLFSRNRKYQNEYIKYNSE